MWKCLLVFAYPYFDFCFFILDIFYSCKFFLFFVTPSQFKGQKEKNQWAVATHVGGKKTAHMGGATRMGQGDRI